jgi:periplasmic protein TonB
MSMASNADIFTEREPLGFPLVSSIAVHGLLFASIIVYSLVAGRRGESWGGEGGGGDALSVSMTTSIPLPAPTVKTDNILANDSKGLTQSQPKVEEVQPPPDAIPIPDKITKPKPKPKEKPHTTTQEKPKPVEEANNVVPFGEGGPVSGPYGTFSAGGAKGGFGFNGGGDFGSRFSWYVRVVQQKVSENWLKYEVDPRINAANRVYVTFDIARNGQPRNIQVEQSSGVPSLDQSAVRALQRIDTFGPLPPDYGGNQVSVEFWFDYKR